MMTEKKINLMNLLGKVEIASAKSLSILLGSKELTADRKRLAELENEKLVKSIWRGGEKAYFLTMQGIHTIDTHIRKPFNPGGYSTDHALCVARFAAFIHIIDQISAESIIFDRDMELLDKLKPQHGFSTEKVSKKTTVHAPDFAIESRCHEVELTQKNHSRLQANFLSNARYFHEQIWLVPDHLHSLQNELLRLAKDYNCGLQLYTTSQVDQYLSAVDLKSNCIGSKVDLRLKEYVDHTNKVEWD